MGDLGFETLQFRDLSVDKTDSSGDDLSDCVVSACSFLSATVHTAIQIISINRKSNGGLYNTGFFCGLGLEFVMRASGHGVIGLE